MYDDVPKFSTCCRGTFHPPVPPSSPLTPPVSLEQLLAPLNAIVQKLAAIDEHQAGQSQPHQQSQESSYFDFWATQPLEFAEATDPVEANNWLRVTESKFGLLHCTELQKTLFVATVVVLGATIAAAIVQLCAFPTATTSGNEATTADHTHRFSTPSLREDRPPCSRFQPSEARQLIVSSGNHGESAEWSTEEPNTTVWPHQLHHYGGNTHGRGSASGNILPQQTYYSYTV
jgi:hypothetical protein